MGNFIYSSDTTSNTYLLKQHRTGLFIQTDPYRFRIFSVTLVCCAAQQSLSSFSHCRELILDINSNSKPQQSHHGDKILLP